MEKQLIKEIMVLNPPPEIKIFSYLLVSYYNLLTLPNECGCYLQSSIENYP
jgi:hypothetical protein